MEYDYTKRVCALPGGCRDLVDLFSFQVPEGCRVLIDVPKRTKEGWQSSKRLKQTQQIVGELTIRGQTSVREFAVLLCQHPSQIIVDLLHLGVYSNVDTLVKFRSICEVARKYGYTVDYVV
jgi:hypothetical protein